MVGGVLYRRGGADLNRDAGTEIMDLLIACGVILLLCLLILGGIELFHKIKRWERENPDDDVETFW